MNGLIRQGHFLGAKLRALRKRNGLTLDELSARCVQIDAQGAPSVSYLSMVETGKRTPSAATLDMLAGIFSKEARWFLDENTDVEAAPPNRERGGLEAMPLEPAFLFSHELLQNALPELLSQTGTTGRQFAQLLIRVWQETRHNNFPDIERAAEQGGKRQMPLTLDAVIGLCKHHGLEIRWFDGDGRKPGGALVRSRFEAPGTVFVNKRLRNQEERLKYELAFFVGHKILHNGDGMISPHTAVHTGDGDTWRLARGHGRARRAVRVARFRVQLLRRRAALSAHSVPPLSRARGAQRVGLPEARCDAGAGDAPHDRRVSVSSLAFLRRLRARISACRVPRQRYSVAVGQHEPGVRPLPELGGVPAAATDGGRAVGKTEVADLRHAGR